MPPYLRALCGALLLLGAVIPPATAQDQVPAYSDDTIDAFAEAALDVQRVQQGLEAEMQTAADQAEMEALQQEAQAEAAQAVRDRGLSLDEYNEILIASNNDPALYARIISVIQEKAL